MYETYGMERSISWADEFQVLNWLFSSFSHGSRVRRPAQPGGLTPQSLRSSKTPQKSQLIRAELPSNGYPQPSGSSKLSACFKPLRQIWRPTEYVRSGLGVFPCQAHVPFSASPCFRLWCVFTHFLSYEGEAVDAVTPARLPHGPSPFEEDKLIYATTRTASSGPLAVDSAGRCGRLQSHRLASRGRVRPLGPPKLLPLRYVDDYMFQGPPCGHMAAMRVPSCSPMRTSSSPLCIAV